MPEHKPAHTKKDQDYERLAAVLEDIYLSGYADRKKLMKMSFLKGLASGLGGIIGATIMVALLLWLLSWFNQVPLVGPFADKVQNSIESRGSAK